MTAHSDCGTTKSIVGTLNLPEAGNIKFWVYLSVSLYVCLNLSIDNDNTFVYGFLRYLIIQVYLADGSGSAKKALVTRTLSESLLNTMP